MKLVNWNCNKCNNVFEEWDDEKPHCKICKSEDVKLKPSFGGYKIKGDNSASTKPRGKSTFTRGKS